jgi:hypothetical protein
VDVPVAAGVTVIGTPDVMTVPEGNPVPVHPLGAFANDGVSVTGCLSVIVVAEAVSDAVGAGIEPLPPPLKLALPPQPTARTETRRVMAKTTFIAFIIHLLYSVSGS